MRIQLVSLIQLLGIKGIHETPDKACPSATIPDLLPYESRV